jgi:hypothetical protein
MGIFKLWCLDNAKNYFFLKYFEFFGAKTPLKGENKAV